MFKLEIVYQKYRTDHQLFRMWWFSVASFPSLSQLFRIWIKTTKNIYAMTMIFLCPSSALVSRPLTIIPSQTRSSTRFKLPSSDFSTFCFYYICPSRFTGGSFDTDSPPALRLLDDFYTVQYIPKSKLRIENSLKITNNKRIKIISTFVE